ncbi:hypothetical protein BDN70DRAFT_939222 [Pholiota conissans]|uniref:Uncharacterized protein n=1 Tax=Pholiota conissans TaxID=109636 RepID=A0A9P5YLN3_9AGAR|nr:hypothetical protein BDN70DRAFT_939222 [Pholiota conissans]
MTEGGSGKGKGKAKANSTRKGKQKATVKEESSGDDYPPLYLSDSPDEDAENAPSGVAQSSSRKGKQKAVVIEISSSDEFPDLPPSSASSGDNSDNLGPATDLLANQEALLDAADNRLLRSSPSTLDLSKDGRLRAATNSQITHFAGSAHQGYESVELANAAWALALATGTGYASGVHGPPRVFRTDSSIPAACVCVSSRASHIVAPQPQEMSSQQHSSCKPSTQVELLECYGLQFNKSVHQPENQGVSSSKFPMKEKKTSTATPAPLAKIPERFSFPFGDPRSVGSVASSSNVTRRDSQHPAESSSGRSAPLRSTRVLPSTLTVGDPWYVVIRGDHPGVYATRSLAARGLGHDPNGLVERAATLELANALFVALFMLAQVIERS